MSTTIDRREITVRTIEAWKIAAQELNFEIAAPFEFNFNNAIHKCVAYLPHFGSLNGMVIGITWPPKMEIDKNLLLYSDEKNMFCSFISIGYQSFDAGAFEEALQDWGYFGPQSEKPIWIESA